MCLECTKKLIYRVVGILALVVQVDLWAEDNDLVIALPVGLDVGDYIVPADNPITMHKVELGRLLFFDPRLSYDGTVSCATCHSPAFAFTDGRRVSSGINSQTGNRNAPTLVNRAFSTEQFWDGRADSLEAQATGPMINHIEMGMPDLEFVVKRLQGISGYGIWFEKVFSREVNIEDTARAIASFERTLISGNSPFDQYKAGDSSAIDASAKRGLELFEGKARCNQCHSGSLFTDEKYHNLGIDWDADMIDLGRYLVTGRANEIGAFKTPTLREIVLTAPYMHDGSLATLEETIEFYDRGGNANPFLDVEMRRPTRSMDQILAFYEDKTESEPEGDLAKLNLTSRDRADLVNFMKTLGGQGWQHIKPPDSFPE